MIRIPPSLHQRLDWIMYFVNFVMLRRWISANRPNVGSRTLKSHAFKHSALPVLSKNQCPEWTSQGPRILVWPLLLDGGQKYNKGPSLNSDHPCTCKKKAS